MPDRPCYSLVLTQPVTRRTGALGPGQKRERPATGSATRKSPPCGGRGKSYYRPKGAGSDSRALAKARTRRALSEAATFGGGTFPLLLISGILGRKSCAVNTLRFPGQESPYTCR